MMASTHSSTTRVVSSRKRWCYFILGQLGWLVCVSSAARGVGWVGCCAVALLAAVMEAYLHGVWTRKVDDLVKALGADTGISKSEVSWICADLDEEVGAFRDRSLGEITYPYVFLDATYCKARVNRRAVSQAVVIATGVTADGRLGLPRRGLAAVPGPLHAQCVGRGPQGQRRA